ncbi:MAG: hypothetical protein GY884_06755 [Proteobacteria bacterium]|nr:hypothetical protein [Pseudomonadota bacterium]
MASIGERVGPFRLVGRVEQLGSIELWEAQRDDGSLKEPQRVHVRLLAAADDLDAARYLRGEYEALRRVDDPRIPGLVGFFAGQGALILRHVEGVHLGRIVEAARRGFIELDPPTALDITLEVAHALRIAHSILLDDGARIVHGWLRPDRVWIDGAGEVHVHGLGAVCERIDPRYFPPEQQQGLAASMHSDQFLIGLLLFELLTHTPLYELQEDGAATADVEARLARLESFSPPAVRFLRKVLAASPADRYRVDREFLKALHGLHREVGGTSMRHELYDRVRLHLSELVDPMDVPVGFHLVADASGERTVAAEVKERLRDNLDMTQPPVLLGDQVDAPLLGEDSRDERIDQVAPPPPVEAAAPSPGGSTLGEWTVLLACLLFVVVLMFFITRMFL